MTLALFQAWASAEPSLPLGWQLSGLYRFDELWVALPRVTPSTTTPAAQASTPSRRCGGWRIGCGSGGG